jgi:glutathione peroxidase
MACCNSKSPFSFIILSGIAVIAAGVILSDTRDKPADETPVPSSEQRGASFVLDYEAHLIDAETQPLTDYQGQVILIVNVASECGLTPQYEALEALYREKIDEGFVILAFPANNFGGQEPGSNDEIAAFCTEQFDVTFPLFAKVSVIGEDAHPLYQHLDTLPAPVGQPPTWNFTKFLISREGNAIARFDPSTKPDDPALTTAIDIALAH